MTNLIYEYLMARCIGYENRVKANVLMRKFNIHDHKTFRSYIQHLREDESLRMIGSEAGKKGGYWIINSDEEYESTRFHLNARANEMKKTVKIMTRKYKSKERGF